MDNKPDLELLEKRVAALEQLNKKVFTLIKDQNEVIKKITEVLAVIMKKITVLGLESIDKNEWRNPSNSWTYGGVYHSGN